MKIRPLEYNDLPGVAKQYEQHVRLGGEKPAAGLVDAFRRMFLDSPVYSRDIPSLVIETDDGIAGFQGVQVRDCRFNGKRHRLASLGPLFVSPEMRGGAAGPALMKRALAGAQDLSISDGASDEGRKIWEHLGGSLAPSQSLDWTVPLEPALWLSEFAVRRYQDSRSLVARALRPAALLTDRIVSKRWKTAMLNPPVRIPESSSVTAEELCEIASALKLDYRLQVIYTPDLMNWIITELEGFTCRGEMIARKVSAGKIQLGWYLGYISHNGILTLMQLQAAPRDTPRVLAAVMQEALQRKLVAVTGRLDGRIPSALIHYRKRIHLSYGTRVLVHSRRHELADAVLALDAAVSRSDGEWLMALAEQQYD